MEATTHKPGTAETGCMIGDAKRKLQRTIDLAEDLYEKVNELTRRVEETTETVDDTNARVQDLETDLADRQERLESRLDEQRAVFRAELAAQRDILEAIADDRGIDVEELAEGAETSTDATTGAGSDGVEASDPDAEGADEKSPSGESEEGADERPA
jgi:chromosome segregation ATPase